MIEIKKVCSFKTLYAAIIILLLSTPRAYPEPAFYLRVPLRNATLESLEGVYKENKFGIPYFVEVEVIDEELFGQAVSEKRLIDLKELSLLVGDLANHGNGEEFVYWDINSGTSGGVADLLLQQQSLARSERYNMGPKWIVMSGDDDFFEGTTSKWHVALHGRKENERDPDLADSASDAKFEHFMEVARYNVRKIVEEKKKKGLKDPKVIVLHDQQPLGMVEELKKAFPDTKIVWKGHIAYKISENKEDNSRKVWDCLLPLINQCDAAIFHIEEFRPYGIEIPVYFFGNGINPVGLINRSYGEDFIKATLQKYGITDDGRPFWMQNSRFDELKNPDSLVRAGTKAILELIDKGVALNQLPKILLIGVLPNDNPRNIRTLKESLELAKEAELILKIAIKNKYGEEAYNQKNIFIQPLLVSVPQEKDLNKLKTSGLDPKELLIAEEVTHFTPDQDSGLEQLKKDILRNRNGFRKLKGDPLLKELSEINLERELPLNIRHEIEVAAFQDLVYGGTMLSDGEGWAFALMGIKNHGKPVIACKAGGMTGQIRDGVTGFLVGIDENGKFSKEVAEEQTQKLIVELTLNPDKAREIGNAAKADMKENYYLDSGLSNYLNVFKDLLEIPSESMAVEAKPPNTWDRTATFQTIRYKLSIPISRPTDL